MFFFFYEATHGIKRVPSQSAQLTIVQHSLKGVDLLSVQHVTQVGVPLCVCVAGHGWMGVGFTVHPRVEGVSGLGDCCQQSHLSFNGSVLVSQGMHSLQPGCIHTVILLNHLLPPPLY